MELIPPLADIGWLPCYRIIPSRFPPIDLFERVTDPADLDAVYQIEALTNDRLRDQVGDLSLVPEGERLSGPGTSIIMAAFTHPNPAGSRFTDGSYGVFYATRELETAIAETVHHRALFMQATDEPPQELDMRVYAVDLQGELHDIRALRVPRADLYDAHSYVISQALGNRLRDMNSHGIVYQSVRRGGGECAALFRTAPLTNCRQERHLCYVWDGAVIQNVYEKRGLASMAGKVVE